MKCYDFIEKQGVNRIPYHLTLMLFHLVKRIYKYISPHNLK